MRSQSHVNGWKQRRRNKAARLALHRASFDAALYRSSPAAVLGEHAGGDITIHADGKDFA